MPAMEKGNFPESTYRVQLHAGFNFRDAAALVPYLAQLGVTHLYASPYLMATPGSLHGYDVIDHCRLNPDLGTQGDYETLVSALAEHGMSHIVDVVPNHVGIATNENKWWNSVLAQGPESKYGKFFDIDWDGSPRPELHGKVLMPLLGQLYNQCLESGELKLTHDAGGFWINYFDRRFPVALETLPLEQGQDPQPILQRLNGTPGDPQSFDALHQLLEKQFYRLAYWKNASDEINYRRFFDVNDLAALAMERDDVFDQTHALILQLVRDGKIAGLRIDHPDGLYEPAGYFQRLQASVNQNPFYVVAEKILALDESLPDWSVQGTTGYDFLNMTNGLFVDGRNEQVFTQVYDQWLGEGAAIDFDQLIYEKKKLILDMALSSELHMLAHRLDRLAQRYRGWRDFTLKILMHGIAEVIACFRVYRTYIDSAEVSDRDRAQVENAVETAIRRNPRTDASVFHFIRDVLLQRYPDTFTEDDRNAQLAFTGKFQQLTSPTTAKGIEDTSFYIYNRLMSLNEVGGEPSRFGISADQLHEYFQQRQQQWPYSMSALSTHDTKRSEDVRARLNVLSELPDDWRQAVNHWRAMNQRHKTLVDGQPAPDANDEYLIYQNLLGAWPLDENLSSEQYGLFVERFQNYVQKALREAKVHTIWISPNKPYKDATAAFVAQLLDRSSAGGFFDDFAAMRKRVAKAGLINSLSQTLLRLAAPGVPDTYQGNELWDFSLVDPDNRREVDYQKRKELLSQLQQDLEMNRQIRDQLARRLLETIEDGRAKLFVTRESLRLRRAHPGLFTRGEYIPLQVHGAKADHVFAFLRRHEDRVAFVAVPRLMANAMNAAGAFPLDGSFWAETTVTLPGQLPPLIDQFTGAAIDSDKMTVSVKRIFASFPVCLAISK